MTQPFEQGWGAGSWGEAPWGSGDADLVLLGAVAVRENVVRFYFSVPPLFDNLGTANDAARADRYSVIAVSGVGLDGEPVRPVTPVLAEVAADPGADGTEIDVTLDRPMTAYPAVYRAVAHNLVSQAGAFLEPGANALLDGLRAGIPPLTAAIVVAGTDIANPQTGRDLAALGLSPGNPDQALGTYQIAPSGDYAQDTPLTSYRKRVIRRLTTRVNGFAHLPGYGVGVIEDVKKPARAIDRQRRAAMAEQQIQLEPETVSVSVTVTQSVQGVVAYRVIIQTNLAPDATEFSIPVVRT